MAIGDQFTNIVEKRIMGYQDFGAYFFDYVRTLLRDAIKKMFTLNGTFGSTKINITSSANDTFRLDSNREGADSYGHIMANSDSGTDYAFQNTAAQTYQVGFKYGEHPVLLAINPRTALPEFTRYEESLGEVAAPSSVVNNGSNLTFGVNSVTEVGVSNAGRSIRVWKVYPGAGATTLAVALETCTVSWTGSNNVVTTAGLFGQTTPSTTAADYLVQLVGPTVKRNTDIKDSSYWYIGEITGNGPAATPVGFDMADQNLIPFSLSESQDSANIVSAAIADSPSSLAAGTVFAQLTELLGHVNDRGRIGFINTWSAKQTFSASVPILLTPAASPALASNGDIAYDSTGDDRLIARINGVDRDIVQAQKSRVFLLPMSSGCEGHVTAAREWTFVPYSNVWNSENTDGSDFRLFFPVSGFIPQGSTITQVRMSINAHGTSTGTDRLYVALKRDNTDVASGYHSGGAGTEWVTLSSLSILVDSATYEYSVYCRAQLAPITASNNVVYKVEITFTDGAFARVP